MQITEFRLLEIGTSVPVHNKPSILALDGEREVKVHEGDDVQVTLTDRGPYLIDTRRTMDAAARHGLLSNIKAPANAPARCLLCTVGVCVDPPMQCMIEERME